MSDDCVYYYFAYGSNLLSYRIAESVSNPRFMCRGILKDYKFLFSGPVVNRWYGSAANIKNEKASYVYGAIYEVNEDDLNSLDVQEGVSLRHYERKVVDIINLDDDYNSIIKCFTYEKYDKNECDGKPSPAYLNVIINGARKINLPNEYIHFLRSFEHNNYSGKINVRIPFECYSKS